MQQSNVIVNKELLIYAKQIRGNCPVISSIRLILQICFHSILKPGYKHQHIKKLHLNLIS